MYTIISIVLFDPFNDLRSGFQTHFFNKSNTYSSIVVEGENTARDLTRVAMYLQAYELLQKGNYLIGNGPSSFSTGGAYRLDGVLYRKLLDKEGTISVGSWLGIIVELGLISLFIILFMLSKKILYLSKKSKSKFNKLVENKSHILQIVCLFTIIISSLFLNNFEERALTYWLFYFSYA